MLILYIKAEYMMFYRNSSFMGLALQTFMSRAVEGTRRRLVPTRSLIKIKKQTGRATHTKCECRPNRE